MDEATDTNWTQLNSNFTSGCTPVHLDVLQSQQLFQNTNLVEKIFMFICAAATLIILIDFIRIIMYVLRSYETSADIKYKSLQIIGIYPAVSLTTIFALFIPRADLLCELIITVYISWSMFYFFTLMTLYHGGKRRLLYRFRDKQIIFQSPPLCCCCCCLPKIPTTERNVRILRVLVLQAAVLQPFFTLATVAFWLDGKYSSGDMSFTNSFPYLMIPSMASLLICFYAYFMYFRLCRAHLGPLDIKAKFFLLQFVIVFTRLQSIIFRIMATNSVPACRGILSTSVLSQRYFHIAVILEMFILMQFARRVYQKPHSEAALLAKDTEHDQIKQDNHSDDTKEPTSLPDSGQSDEETDTQQTNITVVDKEPLTSNNSTSDGYSETKKKGHHKSLDKDTVSFINLENSPETNV